MALCIAEGNKLTHQWKCRIFQENNKDGRQQEKRKIEQEMHWLPKSQLPAYKTELSFWGQDILEISYSKGCHKLEVTWQHVTTTSWQLHTGLCVHAMPNHGRWGWVSLPARHFTTQLLDFFGWTEGKTHPTSSEGFSWWLSLANPFPQPEPIH